LVLDAWEIQFCISFMFEVFEKKWIYSLKIPKFGSANGRAPKIFKLFKKIQNRNLKER